MNDANTALASILSGAVQLLADDAIYFQQAVVLKREAYTTTLERNERIQQVVRMAAIFSEELPAIAINFNPGITAHLAALRGPQLVAPEGSTVWNIHQWELR